MDSLPTPEPPLDRRALHIMMGTAAYHASRVARTMALSETDREDAEQDILLALIERRRFFDPARGAWSSFADRVARQMAQVIADRIGHERRLRGKTSDAAEGCDPSIRPDAVTEPPADPVEQEWLVSALIRFFAVLPAELAFVALLALREDGDVGQAQRQSGLSIAEFYRRLRETRCRMICVGIVRRQPSLGTVRGDLLARNHPSTATKGTRAHRSDPEQD
jgi:DNA-directed RNA polymerase specialized sigma24 family protein